MTVMNDSFESDERKRKETIECLYWSLMNGWDIPKDIREHYGFSEDYELYHRLESMEPEDYRERRLRGEIPDAVEVDVRLTHAVEKVFERLCSPPPVQYLDKLYGELEKLGGFIANPKNIDSPFINSGLFCQVCILPVALKVTTGFPVFPLLVVIIITPFAEREP